MNNDSQSHNTKPVRFNDLLSGANAAVPQLSPTEAIEKLRSEDVLVLDVRDPSEVEKSGKIKGAVNVSRGLLELSVDPEGPHYNQAFQKDKTILVYCVVGIRSALAGKTLLDMGYGNVFNIGSFKELTDAGVETENA
ncbi:MAG: rhodanese-like sulfurtransferase [Halomonas sp. 54_146]|nr:MULTISPECIES: rhodanese-like domain-containing protein [unclassified Halomonas]KUJ86746.1 MAG: rhodanese-like sulfurtransferase [Halomonas sp. 54_146]HAA44918.1 rhodanese [Halomonas sp.]